MADDVVELILAEHERIRALLLLAGPRAPDDENRLRHAWKQATALLLVHIDAAEEVGFPPSLVRAADVAGSRTAIAADHADIRDAIGAARFHEVGSRGWWLAVEAARAAARRHMDLAEATLLDPLRDELTDQARALVGRQWRAFVLARALDADQPHRDYRADTRQTATYGNEISLRGGGIPEG